MTNQQALPDPSPDHLRAIARTARNSSGSASDDCGTLAYVLYGWRAAAIAFRAQQAALVEAQQPAPSAAGPVGEAPLPLLVRDIAADLGTTPIQVCTALAQLGFGGHSVNMAVTPRMAKSLRAYFASTTPQADNQPAPDPADIIAGALQTSRGHAMELMQQAVDADRAAQAADSVTAPAGATNTETAELLSTTVGLLMGYREGGARQPYKPGSVIAKVVDEVVDHLKGWPYPEPTPPAQAADSVLEDAALTFTAAHIDYVARYGGRCRDCADESGVCPGSGLPCADSRKAIKHVFDALEYGVKHGFIKSPVAARKQGGA